MVEPARGVASHPAGVTIELTTLAPDEAVFFDGPDVTDFVGLDPDTDYDIDGLAFRTLPVPAGEHLVTFATVNDVHFGETVCGVIGGPNDPGPFFSSEPGEAPYPETMNRGAVSEILGIDPALVVVKGDLTSDGTQDELDAFDACYLDTFGEQLMVVRGNHESYHDQMYAAVPFQKRDLPGVTVALLDTTRSQHEAGTVSAEQLEWLDALGADADRPVMVMGHHHPWSPESTARPSTYFGINPDDSEKLVEVVARHPMLVGYWAGHTHRNRVRHFRATGAAPWVEVSCVKDYPGAWAEYRVYEGGVVQVFHRISSPDALSWTERTRGMYSGTYADYALGAIHDRCFVLAW
ncbi:MAG: 3,5-cyclic-AMP phosphodiesterase [Actinomycetota bacterium]|nr:3,5-cyclic-AMP phosphodiesterase [Actinomycetota bacterium]